MAGCPRGTEQQYVLDLKDGESARQFYKVGTTVTSVSYGISRPTERCTMKLFNKPNSFV